MIEIREITAGYGAAAVIENISLDVLSGEFVAIIGPNGCGKSTLLRCAAGLLRPVSGSVVLNGADMATMQPAERARRLAFLPQNFEGGAALSVEEMTMLGRTPHLPPYGNPSRNDWDAVREAITSVGVERLAKRPVGQLSGGERQRVMLARALAQQTSVLLLDEPISSLDIRYQCEILDLTRRLAKSRSLAVVAVLHQINLAAAVCDSMLLMNAGQVHAAGLPHDVMTQENLEAVYRAPLSVSPHPRSGRPQAQMMWEFA